MSKYTVVVRGENCSITVKENDDGYLDMLFKAAKECTGDPTPDRWEWRGILHLRGLCKRCKSGRKS